jgi:hypothetical protein
VGERSEDQIQEGCFPQVVGRPMDSADRLRQTTSWNLPGPPSPLVLPFLPHQRIFERQWTNSLSPMRRLGGSACHAAARLPDHPHGGGVSVGNDRGRTIRLSLARQMIGDFLGLSKAIPLAHGERRIDIRPLRAAVAKTRPRLNWLPLFFKAYAVVAAARPALRRLYVSRPWPYLYEHPENVGSVVISRPLEGEEALFYLPIAAPEKQLLQELDRVIKEARERPFHEIPAFRRQLRLARLPGLIRRLVYGMGMHWTTRQRARQLGTFGTSVLASMGIANLSTWVPWTTMIHYTPFDEAGWMYLRIAIDHRVLDGVEVAYALREMEQVLNTQILEEVQQIGRKKAA